jgi:hypothetical protein
MHKNITETISRKFFQRHLVDFLLSFSTPSRNGEPVSLFNILTQDENSLPHNTISNLPSYMGLLSSYYGAKSSELPLTNLVLFPLNKWKKDIQNELKNKWYYDPKQTPKDRGATDLIQVASYISELDLVLISKESPLPGLLAQYGISLKIAQITEKALNKGRGQNTNWHPVTEELSYALDHDAMPATSNERSYPYATRKDVVKAMRELNRKFSAFNIQQTAYLRVFFVASLYAVVNGGRLGFDEFARLLPEAIEPAAEMFTLSNQDNGLRFNMALANPSLLNEHDLTDFVETPAEWLQKIYNFGLPIKTLMNW